MTGFFYTIDLGETFGPKLERLAERASYDDREDFAAMVLAHAIEHWEEHERLEDECLSQKLRQMTFFDLGLLPQPEYWPEREELPF